MPNYVTNKIIFDSKNAGKVYKGSLTKKEFDFEKFVPMPLHVYRGDISSDDEKDFPINWRSWSLQNWGTKWGAMETICGKEDSKSFIQFDTAWSVPYPIIAAFANKFKIPFELKYFDEGHLFWGYEKYGVSEYCKMVHRIQKDYMNSETKDELYNELKGE